METITEQISETLLYEEFGGRKYYRRGYREVLLGLKDEDEIRGNSFLQGLIVSVLLFRIKLILQEKKYWLLINETGQYFDEKETYVNDIAIVERSKILNPTSPNYNNAPPKFVIELDIKIDPSDYSNVLTTGLEMAYMIQKSEKLIEFGIEGIAWVLTESRKILLMRPNLRLEVFEWTDDVPLFDDYTFCLQTILEEEDILPPSSSD